MERLDIRDNLRDDERRRRDEARLKAVQDQVEELRLALREQNARQVRTEEVQKTFVESLEQLGARLDAQRAEALGANDARQLEAGRLRQAVEDLTERIEAGVRPLPGLQAQVTEVANQTRARFQELTQDHHRFDELQAQIDRLPPQLDRNAQLVYGFRDELNGLRGEIETVQATSLRVNDAIQVVEQDVRRRVGSFGTTIDEVNARIDALRDELPPLDVQIDRVRHELHQALPRFDQLEDTGRALREEVERIASADYERHGQALARQDELRVAIEERIKGVERLNDTRFASTMGRFTELEAADRHLAHRLTLLAVRLEELREETEVLRGEMRQLEELRLRVRLEQARQEAATVSDHLALIDARRERRDDEDDHEP